MDFLDILMKVLSLPFGQPWVAPFVIFPTMTAVAIILSLQAYRRCNPFWRALEKRLAVVRQATEPADGPDAAREAFAKHYDDIVAAMVDKAPGADSLVQAWREFSETLVDETQTPIVNTYRPSTFFAKSAPSQLRLTFWSNLFVGIGLILTFFGLIVALYTAQKGMVGNDPSQMQSSLIELLRVAGAKFFASVAGVFGSLLLRRIEYQISRKSRALLDELCSLLERGLLYVPPQKIAIEQLVVLKEQRDQLKMFNTDFALQLSERIGAQFQQAIQPVAASITTLSESIADMSQGMGAGAAKAIEEASGGELRALGQTLTVLGERLDGLSATVANSGDDAARQIKAAGEDFSKAALDIREAFERLSVNIDGMGGRLAEQGEAVANAQSEAMAQALQGFQDMQGKTVGSLHEAISAIQSASADAANQMQQKVGEALATGVSESQRLFRSALEESGEGLKSVSAGLTRAVAEAADKISAASGEFVRSGESAAKTAVEMSRVVDQSRTVAAAFDNSANSFVKAAAPVAQAAQAVSDASERIAKSVQLNSVSEQETLDALRQLANETRDVQTAAQSAWNEYRGRFENVDSMLGASVDKLGVTLDGTFSSFRDFAQKLDGELGTAVGKLQGILAPIEEYAEALERYVTEMQPAEAAE